MSRSPQQTIENMVTRKMRRLSTASFDQRVQTVRESTATYDSARSPTLFWQSKERGISLYKGDSLILLERIVDRYPKGAFDLIFADPPYFLSNGGITCHAGRMVSVNKGDWDRLTSVDEMHEFNRSWLKLCQAALKPNGTLFVSGTSHVIHSVGFAMQQLGFKLLNDIVWLKPNPPPNLSCRYFTHATETIIWAAKNAQSKHCFNYHAMRDEAGGKQMKSVWDDVRWDDSDAQVLLQIYPPGREEKVYGKHPTQKPLALLERIVLAASNEADFVFDPFLGSGTTAIAAMRHRRRCIGCELDPDYISVAVKRLESEIARSVSLFTR